MICKHNSKLNGSMYFYVSQTIQLNSHLFTQLNNQTVLFLTIEFSIGHLFTQLNNQTVLFLTIEFSIGHLFTQLNNQTVLFLTIEFSIGHLFKCQTVLP